MASSGVSAYVANRLHQQHKTIEKQTELIDQQVTLINALVSLIDNNGLGHLVDGSKRPATPRPEPPPPPPVDPNTYGPKSQAIKWSGDTSDIIPMSINSKGFKAFFIDGETIELWNRLLDMRRKIPKYLKEYREERATGEDAVEQVVEAERLDKLGVGNETHKRAWTSSLAASNKRVAEMYEIIYGFKYKKRILSKKVARRMRKILVRNGLRNAEGTGWLQDLRASKQAKGPKGPDTFNRYFTDEEEDMEDPDNESIEWNPPTNGTA